jgi:hypothetical protein
MRRFFPLAPILVLFLALVFPAFSEDASNQIVLYRLKDEGKKEICDNFSPGEKIYADFVFLPEDRQTSVEFKWINPLNNKEQFYSELVRSSMPPMKQTVLCWLYLPSSLPEKVIGSRYFGRWLLEVWVNNHRAATKVFDVGN